MSAMAAPATAAATGLRVLLVEDDPLVREVLAAALEGAGYDVQAEVDGSHVERAVATFLPDIALIDLHLGDSVSGITVARRLRATKEVPLTDELRERLDIWKSRLPNAKNINPNYHGFESYSYSVMLLGLNFQPEQNLPVLDLLSDQRAAEAFDAIRQKTERLVQTLPSQYEYLSHVRAHAQ